MKVFSARFLLIATTFFAAFLSSFANANAASATVSLGHPVTLNATADGSAPFIYQWYKNGSPLTGATGASYTIASFQAANVGTYTAIISNDAGSATSDEAVLTLAIENIAPVITTQPVSQTVTAGDSVTFTAAASGTPSPTFQWKKNGTPISGATSDSFTISSTTTGSAGSYTVVATNSAGAATSGAATLTVNIPNSAPVVTTQPTSQTVTAGGSATFTSAASGVPAPTYQWKKNGATISGATSASYTLANTTTGDAGSYAVVVTNSVGSVTSYTATLTVNIPTSAPAFTIQPLGQSVITGSFVTFTAAASGVPAPTYQWKKNGATIAGATSASYTLASATTGDAGSYTVVANNSAGAVTSNVASLSVSIPTVAPVVTSQPASQTVTVGDSVTFAAAASGTPAPTYQWKKNGATISGATSASYTLASATTGNAGAYTVVATNSAGTATSNAASLTVNMAPVAPVITTQPVSQTVTVGDAVTFTAAASGTPAPTFQWQKNGATISGATSASYTLASATTGNAGAYTVMATNSAGAATSSAASLTVNMAPVAPAITTQPVSQTVTVGDAVTFTAAASGTPAPTFQWQKNGATISGATSASYTLASATTGNAGAYTVVATNSAGTATSNGANLTVDIPTVAPVIITQPVSQAVTVGGSVIFTAVASGTPTPTYQWKKNGAVISGATRASYKKTKLTSANEGTYTVVVSNSAGSVISDGAILTVDPVAVAPVFTAQPVSQTVTAGGQVTLAAAATGTPAPTFQWKKNGVAISGATSSSYIISVTTTADEASYTVVASNTVGTVTSDAAVLSVNVPPKNAIVTMTIIK